MKMRLLSRLVAKVRDADDLAGNDCEDGPCYTYLNAISSDFFATDEQRIEAAMAVLGES